MRNVSDKSCREIQNTHFKSNIFFFFSKSCPLLDNVEEYCRTSTGHRWQYGACAMHAGYRRLQTHTGDVKYLLLFHCNNGCTNAPFCYVIVYWLSCYGFHTDSVSVVCVFSGVLHFLIVEGRIILSEQCNIYVNFLCFFCTVHCNITFQYKPTTCTLVKIIFLFLRCILRVSKPRVHFQEDGCTYSCGIICLHTNGM